MMIPTEVVRDKGLVVMKKKVVMTQMWISIKMGKLMNKKVPMRSLSIRIRMGIK